MDILLIWEIVGWVLFVGGFIWWVIDLRTAEGWKMTGPGRWGGMMFLIGAIMLGCSYLMPAAIEFLTAPPNSI